MKKNVLLLSLSLLFLVSCGGVDSDLVASGKIHQCNIQKIKASLEDDPENEELQAELMETISYYKDIISLAPEGGETDLVAAIKKAVEEGCE